MSSIQIMRRHGRRLGHRYYYDAIYSGGGAEGYQRSNAAYRKALALEPGRSDAAGSLAINLAETGNLDKALGRCAGAGKATSG